MLVKRKRLLLSGESGAPRRHYVFANAGKAAAGLALSAAFIALLGTPDTAESVAIAGLCAPALLALLGLTAISLELLETLSFVTFAALIGYLAILTGGLASPLIIWFALVPAEAALAGGRTTVVRAGAAAAIAAAAVGAVHGLGILPHTRLDGLSWQGFMASVLAAVMQAALIAAAAQDPQRAANQAAAGRAGQ